MSYVNAKRNKEIVARYYSGVSIAELANMYFLSEKRIHGIIHESESSVSDKGGSENE